MTDTNQLKSSLAALRAAVMNGHFLRLTSDRVTTLRTFFGDYEFSQLSKDPRHLVFEIADRGAHGQDAPGAIRQPGTGLCISLASATFGRRGDADSPASMEFDLNATTFSARSECKNFTSSLVAEVFGTKRNEKPAFSSIPPLGGLDTNAEGVLITYDLSDTHIDRSISFLTDKNTGLVKEFFVKLSQ